MKKILACVFLLTLTSNVFAADCVISVNRTACAGKEAEMLKPYEGKNPTEEKEAKATTAELCKAAGEKAAKIVRKGIIAKKATKATFDGKVVGEASTEKECK